MRDSVFESSAQIFQLGGAEQDSNQHLPSAESYSRFCSRLQIFRHRRLSQGNGDKPLFLCRRRRSLSLCVITGRIEFGRSAKLRCGGSIPPGASTPHLLQEGSGLFSVFRKAA